MNRIKAVREQRNITQTELAKRAGISQPFIHDLENGNRNARAETMRRIAEALGCSEDDLRGGRADGEAS